MTNQNPEPLIISERFEINAGGNSGLINTNHGLAAPQILSIFAVYCYVYPGYLAIGDDDDYNDRHTWTDVQPVALPFVGNDARPNDAEGDAIYVQAWACCNPRPWTDVSLEILVDANNVPSKIINMGVVASKLDRTLPFSVPVKVEWEQRLYLRGQNNNQATADADTYTKFDVMLNGEITNYEQLRVELETAERIYGPELAKKYVGIDQ